jgi:mannose-6-phosphate isomerase-like protein (cupin superfamily)
MTPNILRPFKFGKETFHPQSFDESNFVMKLTVEEGGAVPPHKHLHTTEHFRILKGEVTFKVNGEKVVRKAGEELFVPKLTPHSFSVGKNEAEMIVTFVPCADTHHLFQILAVVEPTEPITVKTMSKALYVMLQMNLRQFSNPHPAIANSIINAIIIFTGKVWGWDKLINKYCDTTNTTNR